MTSTELFLDYRAYRAAFDATDFAAYLSPVPYAYFLELWMTGTLRALTPPIPRDSDE